MSGAAEVFSPVPGVVPALDGPGRDTFAVLEQVWSHAGAKPAKRTIMSCHSDEPVLADPPETPAMHHQTVRRAFPLALVFVCAGTATAQNSLFNFNVMATNTSGLTLNAGGSSMPDLIEDLIDTQGQFSSFAGVPFSAGLTYAGVQNAAVFTLNGSATQATLTFPILGSGAPVRTFDAVNGDLDQQLKDYFLKDAPSDIEDFLQAVARNSVLAVTDGNPSATTARMARFAYDRFGSWSDIPWAQAPSPIEIDGIEQQNPENAQRPAGTDPLAVVVVDQRHDFGTRSRFRFDVSGGVIDSDVADGGSVSFDPSFEYRFNENVGLIIGTPISYHRVEGANVFNLGAHLGLPIALARPENGKGFSWQVTPSVLVAGSASYDFAAGTMLLGYGITNLVNYSSGSEVGDWGASLIVHYSGYNSQKISYDDYEFDSGVDQQIFRAGGRFTYNATNQWTFYAGAAYTDFIEDAAIDNYISPEGGVAMRTEGGNFNLRFGYQGDLGDGYNAHQLRLVADWRY